MSTLPASPDFDWIPKAREQLEAERGSFDNAQSNPDKRRVLIIYTGGTFGCDIKYDSKGVPALDPLQGPEFFPVLKDKVPLLRDLAPLNPALGPTPEGARYFYHYLPKTLDSTNAKPQTWSMIAQEIERYKTAFDGFVVIQGTDTLYYTTAALTFLLAGTLKPIIVTGAQTPLKADVNDAVMNVTGAARCCMDVPGNTATKADPADPKQVLGVYLYFNFRLMNGTRCMKLDSHNYGAFTSPNMGYVAHAQPVLIPEERSHVFDMETVKTLHAQTMHLFENRLEHLDKGAVADQDPRYAAKRAAVREMLSGRTRFDSFRLMDVLPIVYNKRQKNWLSCPTANTDIKVAVVRLTPGIDSAQALQTLTPYLCNCDGIIVEAYGAGNAQDQMKRLLRDLREQRNIPVAIITECNHSGVASDYGVAIGSECGALCHDMTPGCAYTRMYLTLFILGFVMQPFGMATPERRDRVEEIMCTPMLLCFTPKDDNFLRNRLVAMGV